MVNRKNISKINEASNLYVSIDDFSQKRKSLLAAIKFSLITQGEYENILELRASKSSILKDIKRGMTSLNSDYQKLKNFLPNVKNVISYTEKELSELERQVLMLKSSIKVETKSISEEEHMIEKLKEGSNVDFSKKVIKKEIIKKKVSTPVKKKHIIEKNLSKLDRIKNNLKVIEAKLKDI